MIEVTARIRIDEAEIRVRFVRSSGPGGQNVNKVATAVQLRFDVANSPSLPATVRARLTELAGRRMTNRGVLVIEARRHRTQQANREDAYQRLLELLKRAAVPPKSRRRTRPTAGAKRKRIADKKHRGGIKRLRKRIASDPE